MSAGLFGAYTGNPRLQRAYASAPCPSAALATTDDSLNLLLGDFNVTCIEIEGQIHTNGPLAAVGVSEWVGGQRETEGLTIFGQGADDGIDGHGNSGFDFELSGLAADAELVISGLTLRNLVAPNYGGALYAYIHGQTTDFNIDLTDVIVENNGANLGGAIYAAAWGGSSVYISVTRGHFEGNVASDSNLARGGAIWVYSEEDTAALALSSASFERNLASGGTGAWGGAVAVDDATGESLVTIDGASRFIENSAHDVGGQGDAYGGAVFSDGSIDVSGSADAPVLFADDTANYGGAIYAKQGGAIRQVHFERNIAVNGSGGAVYSIDPGHLLISDSTFEENRATGVRGGALVSGATTQLVRSSMVGNYAKYHGGAGVVWSTGSLAVESSFIGGNAVSGLPTSGGGAFYMEPNSSGAPLELYFSTLYDDTVLAGGSGPAEIWAKDITSIASVVGSSTTGDIWEVTGDIDDTASVSTADDTVFDEAGSGNVAPGALGFGPLDGTLPGTLGRMPEADSVLALAAGPSPLGFAPADNPFPSISRDQFDVLRRAPFTIGARQYPWPTPPAPPAPSTPASPPREVTAVAGVQSAEVSWGAPASTGSFPVTSYQVTSNPGGHGCLVSAPALTCTITGLTAGESYTFVAKALNGAGWSSPSAASNAVVPEAPPVAKAILITSSRDRVSPSIVRVDGTTTGLVGAEVTPYVRKLGQTGFTPGSNVRTVDADGRFTWQRKSGKKLYVYFTSGDVRSNRLIIGPS
jgi:predicted outer membrane repeat protein